MLEPELPKIGRPPRYPKPRSTTAMRFPPELLARLHEEADARDVSVNWLVNRAVIEFLDRLIPVEEMKWTR